MEKHNWKENDDIVVLYISKFGMNNLSCTKKEIAQTLDVSCGSLNYRIGNFNALQGFGKATNFAKLSKNVYDKFNSKSEKELYAIVKLLLTAD